jgi:hypothetical protein
MITSMDPREEREHVVGGWVRENHVIIINK